MTHTGMGPVCAQNGLAALADAHALSSVIGAGVGGGLVPELAVGDVVLSGAVWDSRGAPSAPDRAWIERAVERGLEARVGTLVTVERVASTAANKAALRRAFAGDGAAIVVDMESAAWARVAGARKIPYVIARSVLDRADEDLPDVVLSMAENGTGEGRARVALALRRPQSLFPLARVALRLRACRAGLTDAVEQLLDAQQ